MKDHLSLLHKVHLKETLLSWKKLASFNKTYHNHDSWIWAQPCCLIDYILNDSGSESTLLYRETVKGHCDSPLMGIFHQNDSDEVF